MANSNKVLETHEAEIKGCRVVVDKLGVDSYDAYVAYKSYNANGVHIASPVWRNIGSEEETKSFIIREVNRASDHNKPPLKAG